ncbi:MAG: hypothetical protein AABY93_10130 [Bacteroidota bacterium]
MLKVIKLFVNEKRPNSTAFRNNVNSKLAAENITATDLRYEDYS